MAAVCVCMCVCDGGSRVIYRVTLLPYSQNGVMKTQGIKQWRFNWRGIESSHVFLRPFRLSV